MSKVELPAPKGWTDQAVCKNRPVEWFGVPDVMETTFDMIKTREDVGKGIQACQACPVRDPCLTEAHADDLVHTVRGGLWPTGLGKRMAGRPRKPSVVCPNGHDKEKLGFYGKNSCLECRSTSHHISREEKASRRALKVARMAEEDRTGTCAQGHSLGPVAGRTVGQLGYKCTGCRMASNRERNRRLYWANKFASV